MMSKKRSTTQSSGLLAEWASQLPDTYLLCRDIGHNWQPVRVTENVKTRSYAQLMTCPRCGTARNRVLAKRTGEILGSGYTYPDGYVAPKGAGWMSAESRGSLRLVSIARIIDAAKSGK